ALLKADPFQYRLSLLRLMLTSTFWTPLAPVPVSLAVPEMALSVLTLAPLAGLPTLEVGAVVSTVMPLELVPAERLPAASYRRRGVLGDARDVGRRRLVAGRVGGGHDEVVGRVCSQRRANREAGGAAGELLRGDRAGLAVVLEAVVVGVDPHLHQGVGLGRAG